MNVLAALFLLRVVGQLLVSRGKAPFLPPMDRWQSGLLAYPLLLASQCAILAVQASVAVQRRRRAGALVSPRPRLGRAVHRLSLVYAGSMALRYAVSMARHPERRWLGGTIPIVFHLVLATYLLLYARLLACSPRTRV